MINKISMEWDNDSNCPPRSVQPETRPRTARHFSVLGHTPVPEGCDPAHSQISVVGKNSRSTLVLAIEKIYQVRLMLSKTGRNIRRCICDMAHIGYKLL